MSERGRNVRREVGREERGRDEGPGIGSIKVPLVLDAPSFCDKTPNRQHAHSAKEPSSTQLPGELVCLKMSIPKREIFLFYLRHSPAGL